MPIFIIGSVLVLFSIETERNNYKNLLESYNKGLSTSLYEVITQIQTISDSIVYNDELMSFLNGEYENEAEMRLAASKVTLLDDYVSKYAGVELGVYVDHESMIDYGQFHKVTDEVRASEWYVTALAQYRAHWLTLYYKNQYNKDAWNITLVRRMVLVGNDKPAVIMIKISNSYLQSRFQNSNYLTVMSVGDGVIGYSSGAIYIGTVPEFDLSYLGDQLSYTGNSYFNGQKTLTCVNTLRPVRSSDLIYLITYDTGANEKVGNTVLTAIIIFILALLLPLIFVFLFSNRFASEVQDLRNEMGKASAGEYDSMKEELNDSLELHEAFEDLRSMVKNIKTMEAKQYEKVLFEQDMELRENNLRLEQQRMEYKLLSNQINPHFLYNTLETIRMKAIAAGDREVGNAIKLLGKSMRYVLDNTGFSDTTLSLEAEHVRTYLEIQKLRFADRLDYSLNMAKELPADNITVLPIMIQPIAENAIVHGLEGKPKDWRLEVDIFRDKDDLVIIVKDNGKGIEPEKLEKINAALGTGEKDIPSGSIGIVNIDRRIRLRFGNDHGINISSVQNEGTTVTVKIPYIEKIT